MDSNQKFNSLIDLQLIIIVLYIASLIISYFITLNEKRRINHQELLFSRQKANKIILYNRYLVTILVLGLLYTDYQNYKIAKQRNQNTLFAGEQLSASILSTLSAGLILFAILTNPNSTFTSDENPEL